MVSLITTFTLVAKVDLITFATGIKIETDKNQNSLKNHFLFYDSVSVYPYHIVEAHSVVSGTLVNNYPPRKTHKLVISS